MDETAGPPFINNVSVFSPSNNNVISIVIVTAGGGIWWQIRRVNIGVIMRSNWLNIIPIGLLNAVGCNNSDSRPRPFTRIDPFVQYSIVSQVTFTHNPTFILNGFTYIRHFILASSERERQCKRSLFDAQRGAGSYAGTNTPVFNTV